MGRGDFCPSIMALSVVLQISKTEVKLKRKLNDDEGPTRGLSQLIILPLKLSVLNRTQTLPKSTKTIGLRADY